jgi:hypothetical protein
MNPDKGKNGNQKKNLKREKTDFMKVKGFDVHHLCFSFREFLF